MSKRPVGIQVYGLRDLLAETPDRFEEVMKEVKAMGYDGVELAGLYGLDPAYIRDVLDRVGLVPVSAHVPLAEMMADAEKVAADYKTIGVSYIAVPYLPGEYRPLTEGYPKVIEEMKRIGAVMKAHGIQLLYHNHDFEFVTLPDGTYGFDDIYRQIDADLLKAEPDLCWIDVAIGKPAEYVKKYADRCPVVHLKDYVKRGNARNMYKLIGIETEEKEEEGYFGFRPVGFGQQVWGPILDEVEQSCAEWVIVEQDEHYELSPLEAARRSRLYLKILGW